MVLALAPCGTEAAYRRHRRHGEDCEECRAANAAAKAGRVDERRADDVAAAAAARPAPEEFDQLSILREVLTNLRGQLAEAPPQSVAAIAKQVRDTASEIAQLSGVAPAGSQTTGGGVDDIAARRAEREARRSAAAQG